MRISRAILKSPQDRRMLPPTIIITFKGDGGGKSGNIEARTDNS